MKTNNFPNWLVPVKLAKKLKKIGFDDETLFLYNEEEPKNPKIFLGLENEEISSSDIEIGDLYFYKEADMESYECILPTWEQVFEWFREKGLVAVIVTNEILNEGDPLYFPSVDDLDGDYYTLDNYYTYEEARVAVLNKLIELYGKSI